MDAEVLCPSDLGLILSYRCQCRCAHCIYNCGPGWQDWIAKHEITSALRSALNFGSPFQVHITGGEPFLRFDLLKRAVRVAARLGIPVYVETNAAWCVNERLTEQRFSELYREGLQAVLISCSPFHAAHVPLKRTLLAARVASEVFGAARVMVYLPEWLKVISGFSMDNPVPLEEYTRTYGRAETAVLFWQRYGLIPGGRSGYRLGDLVAGHSPQYFSSMTCRYEILYAPHSHFDLYGNFIPGFCGGLSVGSWHDLPALRDNFSAGRYSALIHTLIEEGPYGLYRLACSQYGYVARKEGYVGKCHLCIDARCHLARKGNFDELKPVEFYDHI